MKKENEFTCLYGHNIISNGLIYEPKKFQSVNTDKNSLVFKLIFVCLIKKYTASTTEKLNVNILVENTILQFYVLS